ncbi:hypothetical protein [Pseudonocardia spirodelae]|uniref:O-antigen polysaccharide polymerase Wzy n=1 Tax=Pseudonocardia spirodelae TaxID=3133431 RepID=A0ABU8T4D8_9PSEU
MPDAVLAVTAAAAALAVLTAAALLLRGIPRVLVLAQVAYWALSYVLRPAVLLWVQPVPTYGDDVADPRLYSIGYPHGIAEAMQPVVYGLWLYALLALGYACRARGRPPRPPVRTDPDLVATLVVVWVVGCAGRAAAYLTGSVGGAGDVTSANPVLDLVASLAGIGGAGLILFLRPATPSRAAVVIGGLLAVELGWAIASESKSPVMAAALAVAIRFALLGWSRRRTWGVLGLAAGGIAGFGWLQSFKLSGDAAAAAAEVDSRYPGVVRPFLPIVRRFDLLQAATDAYYMSGRTWLTPGQVVTAMAQSFVPSGVLGGEKLHSGTAWAFQVRGSSVDMRSVSVALADGSINEGQVLGGLPGVTVGALFTFGLLLLAVRWLHSRHVVAISLGIIVTTSPILDERGILGSTEVVGKGLQAAVVVWVVAVVVTRLRRRARPGPSGPPPPPPPADVRAPRSDPKVVSTT